MNIAKKVVSRPTTFLIIYLLVVGMALYILPQIPLDLYPDIDEPSLYLSTSYPGAGPEEVEKSVTRVLEGVLTNISNVKSINSISSEGDSTITLELGWGVDLSEASNEIRDKLEFVKDNLPSGAETPQIFKYSASSSPVLMLTLEGPRSPTELYEIVENQVIPRLEQINGVGLVSAQGGREKAVRVEISQNRLEAHGLSMTQVTQALRAQNVQMGSGSVYEGNIKYLVETRGEFQTVEEILDTMVVQSSGLHSSQNHGAEIVQIRDLADVVDGYKDVNGTVFVNGEPGIFMMVQKQGSANSVEVVDRVLANVDRIRSELPSGVNLTVLYDNTTIIRQSLSGVTSSALLGAGVAMLVLLFFLRSFKSTLIIGLSIPVSLLVTLMVMYFFGLTLNIMTLAGLALGIGMIVDSSIVILENIFRYREKGSNSGPAAFLGSQEMITAIAASILTTVAIFLPLLLFKKQLGVIGVLFQDLAITIVVSLLASLVVAISLTPVLASKYLKLYTRKQRPLKFKPLARLDRALDRGFHALDNAYKTVLALVLDHKVTSLFIIILVFAVSLFTLQPLGGNVGIAMSPDQSSDVVIIDVELPMGTRHDVTEATMQQLAAVAEKEVQGYQDLFFIAGSGGSASSNQGSLYLTLPPFEKRIETNEEINRKMRARYKDFPSVNFNPGSGGGGLFGNASPIDIVLRVDDLEKAYKLAEDIKTLLENQVPEVTNVQVSQEEGLPIASVTIDRNKAYALGLNVQSVAEEISAAVNGNIAGRYRGRKGNAYDILVILSEEDREAIPDLDRIFVISPQNERIPVSSIARVQRTSGPSQISREDRARVTHITAGQASGISLNAAEEAVKKAIQQHIVLEEDVVLQYSGEFAEVQKYLGTFGIIMLVALALVYGIMASLFESLLDPFLIFLSIFLMIPGVLFIYFFANINLFNPGGDPVPITMFTVVGILMLVGISVNNGIVLVDYSNLLRNRGMKIREAAIEAGGNRLRPVLMTSLTTIVGMLPLAFNKGEGGSLIRPIGLSIVGGMSMSTVMTLFFVPILYTMINQKYDSKKKKSKNQEISALEIQGVKE